jgi:hypothetical protein
MSQWPERDWSYNPHPDAGPMEGKEYDEYDQTLGGITWELLNVLSEDVADYKVDGHDWTTLDDEGLVRAHDVDWLGRLLVPPATTPGENRIKYVELMASWHTALPFSEAERHWLWSENGAGAGTPGLGSEEWMVTVRQSEARIVSAGISRIVRGRDLLQRWWAWRREIGEYAGQGSLDQAREAVVGLTALLKPDMGLPEPYLALRRSQGEALQGGDK